VLIASLIYRWSQKLVAAPVDPQQQLQLRGNPAQPDQHQVGLQPEQPVVGGGDPGLYQPIGRLSVYMNQQPGGRRSIIGHALYNEIEGATEEGVVPIQIELADRKYLPHEPQPFLEDKKIHNPPPPVTPEFICPLPHHLLPPSPQLSPSPSILSRQDHLYPGARAPPAGDDGGVPGLADEKKHYHQHIVVDLDGDDGYGEGQEGQPGGVEERGEGEAGDELPDSAPGLEDTGNEAF